MTIPFPFGIEEGCFASDDFQLNCTSRNITVLDRRYTQYLVANVSLDDGFVDNTSYKFMPRVVDSDYDGSYHSEYFHESVVDDTSSRFIARVVDFNHSEYSQGSVVDGIFDFSQEDEIVIKWVVAKLLVNRLSKKMLSMRVSVTTVTAKMSREGEHILDIVANVPMASKEIHICKIIVQVTFLSCTIFSYFLIYRHSLI